MITFEGLVFDSRTPVYLQLVQHVKRQIVLGLAQNGEVLPSRREIAAQANVNPNTVQKAYRQMEQEGFVCTDGNKPSTLCVSPSLRETLENELTRDLVSSFIVKARQNGLSYKKAIGLLSELWEE